MSAQNSVIGGRTSPPPDGAPVRFAGFEFDMDALVLTRGGQLVRLQPQPSRVLAELIRAQGAVVTRDQLRETIWGGRFVEFDQGLNFCIRQIRSVLVDEAETPRFIETLPRRGYRFVARIESSQPRATTPARAARWWLIGVVGAVLIAAGVRVWVSAPELAPTTLDGPTGADDLAAKSLSPAARINFLAGVRWLGDRTPEGYSRAESAFDGVLAGRPDFLPARVGRAEARLWGGKTGEARVELDAILADHPDDSRSHTLRGALALFRDWDSAAARRHLIRGAELSPTSSIANHFSAYHWLTAGDTTEALRSIELALELDPLSPTLNGDAGMVYYWLRRYPQGRELCHRSLEMAPASRAAVYCLFVIEAAAGEPDSLVAAARRLAVMDSAPRQVRLGLDQREAALDQYLEWEAGRLARLPDQGQGTALALARINVLLRRHGEAKAAIQSGLARHSNSLIFLGVDPLIDPIRGDTLVQRVVAAIARGSGSPLRR